MKKIILAIIIIAIIVVLIMCSKILLKNQKNNTNNSEVKMADNEEVEDTINETINETTKENNNEVIIEVNNTNLIVELEDNTATKSLIEKLKENDIIINAKEYGNFEKVGDLAFSLPTSDKRITTEPGEIVLYQGNQISFFYNSNTWSYTKIGKVKNVSQEELKNILGSGDVTLKFKLEN